MHALGQHTWRQTAYVERVRAPASPEESLGRNSSQIMRTFDVNWSARAQAARDFLGDSIPMATTPSSIKDLTGPWISRITPHYYQGDAAFPGAYVAPPPNVQPEDVPGDFVGQPYFWAEALAGTEGISFTGQIDPNDVATYKEARLRISYTPRLYQVHDDPWMIENNYVYRTPSGNLVPDESYLVRYVTKRYEPSVESINLPLGYFYYNQGSYSLSGALSKQAQVPNTLGKRETKINIILTWEDVPAEVVPSALINPNLLSFTDPCIESLVGTVNAQEQNAFGANINTFGVYAPGTLLLTAAPMEPFVSPLGRLMYRIEYHFVYFPLGHTNILYDRNGLGFNPSSPNTNPNYQYGQISTDQVFYPVNAPVPDDKLLYNFRSHNMLFRGPRLG